MLGRAGGRHPRASSRCAWSWGSCSLIRALPGARRRRVRHHRLGRRSSSSSNTCTSIDWIAWDIPQKPLCGRHRCDLRRRLPLRDCARDTEPFGGAEVSASSSPPGSSLRRNATALPTRPASAGVTRTEEARAAGEDLDERQDDQSGDHGDERRRRGRARTVQAAESIGTNSVTPSREQKDLAATC